MSATLPFVSIHCTTFNHSEYIRLAVDGFLSQACDFPVEILVHDDVSTDGTAEILRNYEAKYPDLFGIIYQSENQYSRGNRSVLTKSLLRARGKYVAICDGDDYWTDPRKIAKQVAALEADPSLSFVCHQVELLYQESGHRELFFQHDFVRPHRITLENFVSPFVIHSSSFVFRREFLDETIIQGLGQYAKDLTLWVLLLGRGPGVFLNQTMSVYRQHRGGVWSLQGELEQSRSQSYALLEIDRLTKGHVPVIKQLTQTETERLFRCLCRADGPLSPEALKVLWILLHRYSAWRNLKSLLIPRDLSVRIITDALQPMPQPRALLLLLGLILKDPMMAFHRPYWGALRRAIMPSRRSV